MYIYIYSLVKHDPREKERKLNFVEEIDNENEKS